MEIKSLIHLLLALLVAAPLSFGQSSGGSKGSGGSGASGQNDTQAGGGLGFSIETEMMTYKSVQANSEAIACDIARYLYGSAAGSVSSNGRCTAEFHPNVAVGVIIVSRSSNIFSDFQAWRVDMATMYVLEQGADRFCGIAQEESKGAAKEATKAAAAAFDFTIPTQMLPLAQTALGLFASNQSLTAVAGTVHDRALMNAVARQLKAFKISVLIPEIYNPYTLGIGGYSDSPFFSSLAKLVADRASCVEFEKNVQKPQQKDAITRVIDGIDRFMAVSLGTPIPVKTAGAISKDAAGPKDGSNPKDGTNRPEPPSISFSDLASHMSRVLMADGLARAMGVTSDNPDGESSKWKYVLSLEALESGGTLLKRGNIFGTKIRYSGGAVATYAFFSLDGNLHCSGNIYDFEGAVRPEDFYRLLRKPIPDADEQLSFVRGGCSQSNEPAETPETH